MNSTIRIHAQRIHTSSCVHVLLSFSPIWTELGHSTYVRTRLNRKRSNNAVESKKRATKRQRTNSREEKKPKLISKHIEWMNAWQSVRLQFRTCLISVFANFSAKYYSSSVNKLQAEHRKQINVFCNWMFLHHRNVCHVHVQSINTEFVLDSDCKRGIRNVWWCYLVFHATCGMTPHNAPTNTAHTLEKTRIFVAWIISCTAARSDYWMTVCISFDELKNNLEHMSKHIQCRGKQHQSANNSQCPSGRTGLRCIVLRLFDFSA